MKIELNMLCFLLQENCSESFRDIHNNQDKVSFFNRIMHLLTEQSLLETSSESKTLDLTFEAVKKNAWLPIKTLTKDLF